MYFQIVAFVLEAFFAEMELEKAREADTQVRRMFLLNKLSLLYSENRCKSVIKELLVPYLLMSPECYSVLVTLSFGYDIHSFTVSF